MQRSPRKGLRPSGDRPLKQTLRNPAMKALNKWLTQLFERSVRALSCKYEDNYYGDQLCKCEDQS